MEKIIKEYEDSKLDIIKLRHGEKFVWELLRVSTIIIFISFMMFLLCNNKILWIYIFAGSVMGFFILLVICVELAALDSYPNFSSNGINIVKNILFNNNIKTNKEKELLVKVLQNRIDSESKKYSIGVVDILMLFVAPICTYICNYICDNADKLVDKSYDIIETVIWIFVVGMLIIIIKNIVMIRINRKASAAQNIIYAIDEINLQDIMEKDSDKVYLQECNSKLMGDMNMSKNKILSIIAIAIGGVIGLAFVINMLFKIRLNGIFTAEWNAGDALNYVGTMAGAISTFILGVVAYKQNEKLQNMEDNNYIANNSCMVLIDEVTIKPEARIQVNDEEHLEQMLTDKDYTGNIPWGYKCVIRIKRLNEANQTVPSIVRISKITLFAGDKKENTLDCALWFDNLRDGYTRVAISERNIGISSTLIVESSKRQKFETAISKQGNKLLAEIEFDIITDRYVLTKCKCRTTCDYQNAGGNIKWYSIEPSVFFYGHKLLHRDDIKIIGE